MKICPTCGQEIGTRLDYHKNIAKFLGVSESYYHQKVKARIEPVLFTRPGPLHGRIVFTFKPLLYAYLLRIKAL